MEYVISIKVLKESTGADSDERNVRTCEPWKILLVKNRGNVVKKYRGNIRYKIGKPENFEGVHFFFCIRAWSIFYQKLIINAYLTSNSWQRRVYCIYIQSEIYNFLFDTLAVLVKPIWVHSLVNKSAKISKPKVNIGGTKYSVYKKE